MTAVAKDRLDDVRGRIAKAAEGAGRSAQDIALVAVTKTVPFEKVLPFLEAGVRHVGENRLQEAVAKYSVERGAASVRPIFHLIGPLQTNKSKKAVEFFDMVQSLDRWELAEDLNRHAQSFGKTLDCLIQVKISPEATKSGLDPVQVPEFLSRVATLSHLKMRGLMGIPPLTAQGDAARPYFQRLTRLFQEVAHAPHSTLTVLSMGMSADYEIAVEEGATMVRIGSALFGPR